MAGIKGCGDTHLNFGLKKDVLLPCNLLNQRHDFGFFRTLNP